LKKKGHISFEIDEPKPADAQPLKVQSTDHNFSNTNTVSIQIGKNNFKNWYRRLESFMAYLFLNLFKGGLN
jgi:hypothetical protein